MPIGLKPCSVIRFRTDNRGDTGVTDYKKRRSLSVERCVNLQLIKSDSKLIRNLN